MMTAPLDIDADELAAFVNTGFRYASPGGIVSLRAFHEGNANARPLLIESVTIGESLHAVISAAVSSAHHAAMVKKPAVFCPPLATFNNPSQAREADLLEAFTISVECDAYPEQSRQRLEAVLGPPTMVVASGGEWTDPKSGEVQPKLHLHWRLNEAASGTTLPLLKEARRLCVQLTGADASNITLVHPLRWAGSVHRKSTPRLARIVESNDRDIDLTTAIESLRDAVGSTNGQAKPSPRGSKFSDYAGSSADETAELIRRVMTGESLHPSLVPLAARLIGNGMHDGAVVELLRGLMNAAPSEQRDARWHARFAEIPRIVSSAAEKFAPIRQQQSESSSRDDGSRWAGEGAEASWSDPDISLIDDSRGLLPEFPINEFPSPWRQWAEQAAHGAGVAIDHVAVPLLAILAGQIGASRRIQASRSFIEPICAWAATVGHSGTGKTPGLDASKRGLEAVERDRADRMAEIRRQHETRQETAKAALKAWKQTVADSVANKQPAPKLPPEAEDPGPYVEPRLYVSDATVERQAVLIKARPRGSLLIADELAGLFNNMSRYSNGSDREFWLEAFNGKSFVVERQSRPTVRLRHLLISMAGGFQPDKLSRAFKGDDDGMHARMLFSWPLEPAHKPLSDDAAEVEPGLYNAIARLVDLPAGTADALEARTLVLADAARNDFEAFRRFHYDAKHALDGREREWFAKGPTQVLRLSGLLALMEWVGDYGFLGISGSQEPSSVEARHVASAVVLWRDYFFPHACACIRLIGLTDSHGDARHVLRWMKKTSTTEVSREDVRVRALSRHLDADATQGLIERLVQAGWLREQPATGNAGRPARRWQVNPCLFAS